MTQAELTVNLLRSFGQIVAVAGRTGEAAYQLDARACDQVRLPDGSRLEVSCNGRGETYWLVAVDEAGHERGAPLPLGTVVFELLKAAVRPSIQAEERAAADDRLDGARRELAESIAAERTALAKRGRPWSRLLPRRSRSEHAP
jgi:hypothetical protein